MSDVQTDVQTQSAVDPSTGLFTPPAYSDSHVHRQIEEILGGVTDVVSRVWPLRDYVAINPYSGIAGRTFSDARAFLQVFSDCELLMPMEYYGSQFLKGGFSVDDIRDAIAESSQSGIDPHLTVEQVLDRLETIDGDEELGSVKPSRGKRPIRTIAEHADQVGESAWSETVVDEISKFCSAYYDQVQSTWSSPWKELPLFMAWKSAARHDRNPEILGLTGFRSFVDSLPPGPIAAIVALLTRLQIPTPLWESFLLCQVFSMPGWCAWAKYQDSLDDQVDHEELFGLLAIRLAYDVAISEVTGLSVHWDAMIDERSATFRRPATAAGDDSEIRMLLLRASEIGYRRGILGQLVTVEPTNASRRLAQMVFCIDVRSERIRRQLESLSPGIETFGFAGFFGMPIEYVKLGQEQGDSHVPALIRPHFQLHEGLSGEASQDEASQDEATLATARKRSGLWTELWGRFQKSAVGCFSFVETMGLVYAAKLFANTNASSSSVGIADRDGKSTEAPVTGPTLRGLDRQGWSPSRQADLAESMLRNLGLIDGFARLVAFYGHASETKNNPLAAGLDCGACGGHSGEPNARLAALLLNQPFIREALAERGITIPEDTHFLAGLHHTTTDRLEIYDLDQVPASHQGDLQEVLDYSHLASTACRKERAPILGAPTPADLLRRAVDWSEVRPEWGLAGNAAFFVGPRWMTEEMNLDGRTFLHSYDHRGDRDGAVLENIMTAPMVVANWINMQYYASTVDNRHFGSGDKTVHNVVGGFGVLSGNSGDLMTGLPTQSLHDGRAFQHLPVRLQVLIAAPREAIGRVLEKHGMVKDLVDNGWLHLIAIEGGESYRYASEGWYAVASGARSVAGKH
jgi:uncharacterized protein YbcC (UPF0753/DUF2309 family)